MKCDVCFTDKWWIIWCISLKKKQKTLYHLVWNKTSVSDYIYAAQIPISSSCNFMSKYIKLFFHVTFSENGLLCQKHLDHLQLNQLYCFSPLKVSNRPFGSVWTSRAYRIGRKAHCSMGIDWARDWGQKALCGYRCKLLWFMNTRQNRAWGHTVLLKSNKSNGRPTGF